MSGQDIADLVVDKLSAINWDSNDPSMYRMLSMDAVSKGIQEYINNNWSITATTVGVLAPPPPPPTPHSESVTVNLIVGQSPILMGMLMGMTTMAPNLMPIFSAIASWLSAPPWVVTITSGTVLTPVTGVSVATFPAMVGMGAACLAEMSAAKPDNMKDAWSIMGKHIYNGLVANVIAPIVTVGALGPRAYSGVTTAILTF